MTSAFEFAELEEAAALGILEPKFFLKGPIFFDKLETGKKRCKLDVFEKLKKPKGVFLKDESNGAKIGDGWLDLVELSAFLKNKQVYLFNQKRKKSGFLV